MAYSPVALLNSLWKLQKRVGFEEYAAGFGLTDYGDTSGLVAGWSKDPEFLAAFVPFAQANGSGSFYALWLAEPGSNLVDQPVVVFGDEGGQHVVARNLGEFLSLLAYDTEISVDFDDAYFYRDDDEDSDGRDEYLDWLSDHGLRPVSDPTPIMAAARADYGARFEAFTSPFLL
jgi:hypothetical protein